MTTDLGRPRDPRIDNSVLRATVALLGKSGYADLSVDAIAKRAGTSKPAIYRRWPSKAHLVHEAVFPISEATELPDTGSLAEDVREMVRRSTGVLTVSARGLDRERRENALRRGEVRPDVTAGDLVEAIAGMTLMAIITRNQALDDAWVERTATLITKGISA